MHCAVKDTMQRLPQGKHIELRRNISQNIYNLMIVKSCVEIFYTAFYFVL